jgi:hypothetical protein
LDWSCCADFELLIVNQSDQSKHARWWSDAHHYQFSSSQSSWGRHNILSHEEIYKKDLKMKLAYEEKKRLNKNDGDDDGEEDLYWNNPNRIKHSDYVSMNDECYIEAKVMLCTMTIDTRKNKTV